METGIKKEKVTITCNKMELTMLGFFLHQDFDVIMKNFQLKHGITNNVVEDFRDIIQQMTYSVMEDFPLKNKA